MCDKVVSEDSFQLKHFHDRYKTQEMCNKPVNGFLPGLKFVPDLFYSWFIASKMIKNLLTALHEDNDILYFNEGSGNVHIVL